MKNVIGIALVQAGLILLGGSYLGYPPEVFVPVACVASGTTMLTIGLWSLTTT